MSVSQHRNNLIGARHPVCIAALLPLPLTPLPDAWIARTSPALPRANAKLRIVSLGAVAIHPAQLLAATTCQTTAVAASGKCGGVSGGESGGKDRRLTGRESCRVCRGERSRERSGWPSWECRRIPAGESPH